MDNSTSNSTLQEASCNHPSHIHESVSFKVKTTTEHTKNSIKVKTTPEHSHDSVKLKTTPEHSHDSVKLKITHEHTKDNIKVKTIPEHTYDNAKVKTTNEHTYDNAKVKTTTEHTYDNAKVKTTNEHTYDNAKVKTTNEHTYDNTKVKTTNEHTYDNAKVKTTNEHTYNSVKTKTINENIHDSTKVKIKSEQSLDSVKIKTTELTDDVLAKGYRAILKVPVKNRQGNAYSKRKRFLSAPVKQHTTTFNSQFESLVDVIVTDEDSRPSSVGSIISNISSDAGNYHNHDQTISRSSSRRSRPESVQPSDKVQNAGSDSDNDDVRTRNSDQDYTSVDVGDDKAFDTDLEPDEPVTTVSYDHTGKSTYLEQCKRLGVIPVSFFLRHLNDKQLDMKHHGLGPTGMKAMAPALMSNTTILMLDLSDNWLGVEGGLALCDMLKENCFVTELILSDNHLNKCAEALTHILSVNDTLRRVTLAGNGFDDKAAEHFAELLTSSSRLEYLNLSHNNLSEKSGMLLGPAIAENSTLKELDLSWNHLRRKGAVAVAVGIKNNVYMKRINLSWNGFALEGALALGEALKANSVLEELNVTNNRITTEGAVLIGKGLTVNETLKILMMGKNPMQSAGCWGICAAILRNPNCIIEHLDFSDVLVNKDFQELFKQVKEQFPQLHLHHGGMEPPLKPKARMHPMVKLMSYIDKNNLRLVDFFNKFDKDGSLSITHEQFRIGLKETGINMDDDEVAILLEELDRDGDGEINYSELVIGHTDFQDKEKKMQTVLTTLRPMTS